MSIDRFFNRRYHKRDYNCAHLTVEAMRELAGQDWSGVLQGALCAPEERRADLVDMRRLRFLRRPISPCVVYMQRRRGDSHVGIWYKGKVLHITENAGVQYVPLDVAAAGFRYVRFVQCQ